MQINAIRQPRRFSNLGRPLSKVLKKLIEKNLLRPLPPQQPLPNANTRFYYKFHQTVGHDTDNCSHLKYKIQDLIDAGKITDPKTQKLNIQNNSLPNYRNDPPLDVPILMVGTGLIEEQIFNFFINIDLESL